MIENLKKYDVFVYILAILLLIFIASFFLPLKLLIAQKQLLPHQPTLIIGKTAPPTATHLGQAVEPQVAPISSPLRRSLPVLHIW